MTIQRLEIPCPIFITKIEEHRDIKDSVLKYIEEESYITDDSPGNNISRTDYNIKTNTTKNYMDMLITIIHPYILNLYGEYIGYKEFGYIPNYDEYWFQQYNQNDTHNWHCHPKSSWANVYFLELPDDGPKTNILIPGLEKKIFVPGVKEGDLLTFPSFLFHCSPPNLSTDRKTIISFNIA